MADLAESVDDLICAFDGYGDTTMDTIAMFVFGWVLAGLFVLWLSKLLYAKFVLKSADGAGAPAASEAKPKPQVVDASAAAVSKDDLDAVVKKTSISGSAATPVKSRGGSGGGGGGSAYIPPTPPVRKRISRQSPGPDLMRKTKYTPAPQATGPDNISVLWVNDVFQWLYNDMVVVQEVLDTWLRSMNDFVLKTVSEEGIGMEFIRILPESPPPHISNVFCECASNEDVTITCDCEATPALQMKCFRQKENKVETTHYRVNVNRFRARLSIFCVSEKLLADLKCDGWPDIKVSLAQVGNIQKVSNPEEETHLQELLQDIVVTALRNTEVHLNFQLFSGCPRLVRHVSSGPPGFQAHHYHQQQPQQQMNFDNMMNAFTSTPTHATNSAVRGMTASEKRLLIKVKSAANLGVEAGCQQPYCIVEMDEPPQKNQTSIQKNTSSPFWDEHFLLCSKKSMRTTGRRKYVISIILWHTFFPSDLSPNTQEILFEVYDHATKPHRFLGLGIVGVEELLINPSQRQIIALQSRPYESDLVSGTLTVEFLFIEGADIPVVDGQPFKLKETLRTVSPTGALITTTKTTFANHETLTNGDSLRDSALRELERNKQSGNANKSTLIIHSVQRQPSQRLVKVELSDGTWKEVERTPDASPTDEEKPIDVTQTTNTNTSNSTHSPEGNGDLLPERGRPRKKRDFFGTIKRRLGRSKTRSRSAGPDNENGRDDSMNRSISADRNRRNDDGYKLGIPNSQGETSRRSSLSEASGLSQTSTRTYINEASTLVLETLENGIKKHYLVPLSLAQRSKWRKKGVKLHIFNDHTFIAKHLSGGTVCQVCGKTVARRLGKQGYECRDCFFKCHKHCHVKVNDNCPTSTIHNIELNYITSPITDKNIRML